MTLNSKTNSEKNKLSWRLPDFKTYYKATVVKTVWHWHKERCTDQWNRVENLQINVHIYKQVIIDKVDKSIH